MRAFLAAFWAEALKARRSKVSLFTAIGFLILPLVGGLFMIILKDPERARAMGLISVKAQLFTAGVADWPTYFDILLQGMAIGGTIVFALITAWVFGREFADHTVKELLAIPTPRGIIVGAKFVLIALWTLGLVLFIFVIGLGIGVAVDIPSWSPALGWTSFRFLMTTAFLTIMLMPFVALFASAGRGYLPPLGWAILTLVLAQIAGILGWGDWFPWSVPVLLSGMAGPRAEQVGMHSYIVVLLTSIAGIAATFAWWRSADQAR
ncbi:MAG: ABC transporter permease [Fidelibacterota bacterium]|nr:MAG: ABC transporter permease [Candidatus Neomarinimicrobiota bacterium]